MPRTRNATVSLAFSGEAFQIPGVVMGINYGFDKVRFMTPVKSGAKVRGRFTMADVPAPPEEELKRIAAVMHREGKTQRSIAKAIGRDQATVSRWLNGETKPSKKGAS